MSPRMLVWSLGATLTLSALLFAAAFVIAVAGPLLGEPLLSSWPAVQLPADEAPLSPDGMAQFRFTQGVLQLLGGDGWLLALKAVDVLVVAALALAILELLRRFASGIRDGRPFGDHVARRLRCIAWLLIAWPLWQVLHAALAQAWLLAHAGRLAPDTVLLHTFATAPPGSPAVRLLVDADIGTAAAGIVLLVVAHAFAHGVAQRRDLEGIV